MNAGIRDAEILKDAVIESLERDDPAPLARYAEQRRIEIEKGVNPFTDRMTRILLFGNGRLVRPAFRTMSAVMKLQPLRRRFLHRLAMLR
ncbi:MAG: hypothetical protein R3338_09165, partial [Thermoanaerobaculia bacterium]|nr:hypothetical protein [Thermoanaerobaculia bacterium]